MTMRGPALLAEIVAVLARYEDLCVVPEVEMDAKEDGCLTLTLTVHPTTVEEGLESLALADDLRYVCDVATVRGVVDRYGLNAAAFDELLRKGFVDKCVR